MSLFAPGGKGGGKSIFEVQHPDRTVWLGNLAPGTTHAHLMPVMTQVGGCKRVQVGTKGTGFAFFSNAQEAQQAILHLNGTFVNGSNIQVDTYTKKGPGIRKPAGNQWMQRSVTPVWQPMFQKTSQFMGKGASKGASKGAGKAWQFEVQHPDRTVWLGNIASGTTHLDLLPIMNQVGGCKRVVVGSKGTGFAFFATAEEAQSAITSLNGTIVQGSAIQVDVYEKKGR
eukprot:TRINITY_DN6892_c0_g1_i1.p1 TRINITY_DN6892_c0_g1~~TRINITY_DN6892_c0_g1_i1.p1  ORF type:complete len:227 (-),score=44.83 TRINITY_DN6892_c0_g1_i1:81-761(-)